MIHAACAFDANYELQFLALAESIRRSATQPIVLYAIHTDPLRFASLRGRRTDHLSVSYVRCSSDLSIYEVPFWVTHATLVRLLFPSILPDIDRVIFLDTDVIARRDLGALYHADTGAIGLAACPDYPSTVPELSHRMADRIVRQSAFGLPSFDDYATKIIGLADPRAYFNAGVMVMDVRKLREASILKTALQFLATKRDPAPVYGDQDALNFAAAGRQAGLDARWNAMAFVSDCLESLGEIGKSLADPWIIHFTGRKPWHYPFERPGIWDRHFWDAAMGSPVAWPWLRQFWAAYPKDASPFWLTPKHGPRQSFPAIARHAVAYYASGRGKSVR